MTLKTTVNDPQGLTVRRGLQSLGFTSISSVRMGKYLEVRLEAANQLEAQAQVQQMCEQLLANTVIEEYRYEMEDEVAHPQ